MRLQTTLIILALLVLTIPWPAAGTSAEVFGLPAWAFYTLAANLVFPVVVLLLIRRRRGLFDGATDESEDDRG